MESHLRVEIVPRTKPVTEEKKAQLLKALNFSAASLQEANTSGNWLDIQQAEVDYSKAQGAYAVEVEQEGYLARVNGAELPLTDFAVQYDPESGAPMLSLILAPDSLSIGEPPTATPPAPAAKVSSWGDASQPDPRESIPGWQPEKLSVQVAGHAEARETRAQGLDRMRSLGFARLIEPLGVSAVTA
jgi:hypothetical protein